MTVTFSPNLTSEIPTDLSFGASILRGGQLVVERVVIATVSIKRPCSLKNRDDCAGVGDTSQRRTTIANAVREMLRHDAQGLREFDLREKYVAAPVVELGRAGMIEIHVFTENRFTIDAFVVDGDLVVSDVVVNHHLARANDDHLTNF